MTSTMKIGKIYSLSDSYVTLANNSRPHPNPNNPPHTVDDDHDPHRKNDVAIARGGPNALQQQNNHNSSDTCTINNTAQGRHGNKLNSWLTLKRSVSESSSSDSETLKAISKSKTKTALNKNCDQNFIKNSEGPSSAPSSVKVKPKCLVVASKPVVLQTGSSNRNSQSTVAVNNVSQIQNGIVKKLSLKLPTRLHSSVSECDSRAGTGSKNTNRIKWNTVEYWNFCSPNNTTDDEENSNSDCSLSSNAKCGSGNKAFSPTKYPRLSQRGKRVDNNKILRNLFTNYFKSSACASDGAISSKSTFDKNISPISTISTTSSSVDPSPDPDNKLSIINNQNIDINGDSDYNYTNNFPDKDNCEGDRETENGNLRSSENQRSTKLQLQSEYSNFILNNHDRNDDDDDGQQFESSSKLSVRQREALMGRRRGVLRTMSENSEFYSAHNNNSDNLIHQEGNDDPDPDKVTHDSIDIKTESENLNTTKYFNTSSKQPLLSLSKKFSYEYNFEKRSRKEDINHVELVSTSLKFQNKENRNQNQTDSEIKTVMDVDQQEPSPIKINSANKIGPTNRISFSSDEDKHFSLGDDETSSSYSTAEEDQLESDPDRDRTTTSSSYATPVGSLSTSKLSLVSTTSPPHSRSHSRSRPSKRSPSSMSESKSNLNIKKTDEGSELDPENDRDHAIDTDHEISSNSKDTNLNLDDSNPKKQKVKHVVKVDEDLNQSQTARGDNRNKDDNVNPINDDSPENLIAAKAEALLTDARVVTVKDLQAAFDCFKEEEVSKSNCEILLDSLAAAQGREDFQWALHQLGGFNALLFLYARVVEICPDDETQSKGLSLALVQLRHHSRLTDGPAHRQYHLLRFVLNSERSCFGFKSFIQIMNFCLSASGLKLLDYQLLDTCILSSWQILTRVRCKESDAPTGPKTLLECLLTIILDLLEERNQHRDFNVALLKANRFTEILLAICYHMVVDVNVSLNLMDGLRLGSLVKSILAEMMAPPDAYVAVTLVKYGMCPLLPNELPPLPRKEDAFFIVQNPGIGHSSLFNNLRNIREAEEANEGDRVGHTTTPSEDGHDDEGHGLAEAGAPEEESSKLMKENSETEFTIEKDDVPEIVGIQNGPPEIRFSPELEESHQNQSSFTETFQEALLEGVMSILLNALSIIPDGAFHSVLNPHINAHLLVAYCSHPSVQLKKLSLKLLSAYLTRVKNPVVVDFLKCKGFYLTSLYIQGNPEVSQLALNICSGFGPLSYPLVISLLYSNTVVNKVIEWVQSDEAGKIPALMSMGLLPSIFNIQASSLSSMQKPLQKLVTIVTRFCALHPKDDPWKILFCPALESSYGRSLLIPKLIQEATESLRKNTRKDLKKSDSTNRLMWLIERGSASRMGHHFDKWLLNIFTLHIMEMDEDDETENWVFFVKKNRKKLIHLMGIFLCRVFAANRDNMDFKHYTVRVLLSFSPHLNGWLTKVLKHDEQIERCFTAFVRIFLTYAEQKCVKLNSHVRTPSFHSLIADNGNLTLTLQMAAALPSLKNSNLNYHSKSKTSTASTSRRSSASDDIENGNPATVTTMGTDNYNNPNNRRTSSALSHYGHVEDGDPGEIQLSDKVVRSRFEKVLVDAGILSPTCSSSMFSADFRSFKLLLETSTSGVSPIELRQCVGMVDKMRTPFSLSSNRVHGGGGGATGGQNGSGGTVGGGKQIASTESYFEGIFESVNKYAMEMLINVARARTQQEVEVARRICVQDENMATLKCWINIMEQMRHPKAPWHFPEAYPSFSALDQSEGPGRVRIRLKREHLRMHNRFVMPKYRKSDPGTPVQPLDYLFISHSAELLQHPFILNEIQYMRFCTRIIPGEELQGEIILSQDHLTFIAEQANFQSENVECRRICVKNLLKRRYTLEDRAVEIFLECRSFLFVFKNKKDRDEFVTVLALKPCNNDEGNFHSVNSSLLETSVTSMTSQWLKGQLSNFQYLMYLNTAAGRTYCDLMQYPVFPFVLSKYDSHTLDLLAPQSYRDLKKPMAIQDPSKEEHFISTYNYLKRECDSAPFHYGSHYSNSGIVLHFLVRLPPYTQHFLKYQDGSFDIPDRSFHSVETTWRLASRESHTDFKEAIPEFYYLPEFLQNLQHFDLGVRQNGLRVDNVLLPPWAKGDARLFTLINRQALESNHVRKFICDWIDLIFGYKQEGKAALQALNVFHPSTYEGFEVDGSGDELLIRARKAMVSTYGQTPKQLFAYPHPRATTVPEEKCEMEVLDTVWGIRWGNFVGSPACPDLEVIHTREYSESIKLFETKSRIVFWPENTVILGDAVVGYWDTNSIRVKSTNVFYSIGDDITCCVGTTNWVWIGHQSGRITVLKLSPKLDKVIEKIELVGHYKPVKRIDVNLQFSTAISCSGENYAILWDINKYPKIAFNNAIECPDPIDDIYSSRSTGDVVLMSKQGNRVTLATINGAVVGTAEPDESIESACLSAMDPGRNVNVIAVGCDNGIIRFYSTYDMKFLNQLKVLPLASLSIKSVRYSKDGRRLYCMSQTEEGAVTVALQLS